MSRYYDLNDIIIQIEEQIRNDSFITGLYQSSENICKIINAIHDNGENWAESLDMTPAEKRNYSRLFHPHLSTIRSFFGKAPMKGGQGETPEETSGETPEETPGETPVPSAPSASEELQFDTPDDFMETIVNAFGEIDKRVKENAVVRKMEHEQDSLPDIRIFPEQLTTFISDAHPPSIPLMLQAEKARSPFRLLIVLLNLFLDIARMTAASAGKDDQRRVLSVATALLEVLRGNWKQAVASIMGYMGTAPLFMGQFAKVFLILFDMLSPTIRENFIYSMYDAGKSMLIGLLLTIFKVTALYEVRKPLITALDNIAKSKQKMDNVLESAQLRPRAEYYSPTFEDLENVQALIDDPAFICSEEHQELVNTANKSSVIKSVFEIMRIPITKRFRQYNCKDNIPRSIVTILAEKQGAPKKKPQTESNSELNSESNAEDKEAWRRSNARAFIKELATTDTTGLSDPARSFYDKMAIEYGIKPKAPECPEKNPETTIQAAPNPVSNPALALAPAPSAPSAPPTPESGAPSEPVSDQPTKGGRRRLRYST